MNNKAFLSWSGGKDSALALYHARQQGIKIDALVTTVNTGTNRVSMHGVRKELVEAQAASIGLPLHFIWLPEMPGMTAYEEAVRQAHRQLKAEGFTHGIFGDIFLEDLKAYRESLLAKDGLQSRYPLWQMNSGDLMKEFFAEGFKAVVVCTNDSTLNESFCGRLLDESFIADLPPTADPCGENGEYHSFVFDGPIFSTPVQFQKGAVVRKDYPSPAPAQPLNDERNEDCFATPKPTTAFYFQDLRTPSF